MGKQVKVALIGFGTVGTGVVKILQNRGAEITRKTGLTFELAHVVDMDIQRDRGVALADGVLHNDLARAVADNAVDIAVELVGGTGVAGQIVMDMLKSGKDVVTANKALLAERGEEIFAVARQQGRSVAFEASCCGGIPLVSSIRSGLAANQINAMYGIVNGTCNYILSEMSSQGKTYKVALQEAQQAGFAEADPTLDVNGADSAHKLAILGTLAFGRRIEFSDIAVKGIDSVDLKDIRYGQELGYAMKLLAIAERSEKCFSLRVHPAFISEDEPLARVSGPFNAVSVFGDAVGHTFYYGRGAGMMPTASAVVADMIEVAQGNAGRSFAAAPGLGREAELAQVCPTDEIMSRFYLRLSAVDRPGVFAHIAQILGDNNISISACLQHESLSSDSVPVVIMTHLARQGDMDKALVELEELVDIKAAPICVHVVTPPGDG